MKPCRVPSPESAWRLYSSVNAFDRGWMDHQRTQRPSQSPPVPTETKATGYLQEAAVKKARKRVPGRVRQPPEPFGVAVPVSPTHQLTSSGLDVGEGGTEPGLLIRVGTTHGLFVSL